MTTAEAAADVQVPDNGEHPSPDGAAQAAPPTTYEFTPNGPEFSPPIGFPPERKQIDYGGPIVVPTTQVIVAPGTERWFFYELNQVQKKVEAGASPLEFAFFWLEHSGVDRSVINRVALLPFDEWQRFYEGWMKTGAAGSNLGE